MNILFAGEGGQGIQAIAEILSYASFLEGKSVLYIPNFGVEQRGGVSLAFIVIDSKEVAYPKFQTADFAIILAQRSLERIKLYIKPDYTRQFLGPAVPGGIKSNLPPKAWNILMLGQLNKQAKIVKRGNLINALDQRFKKQFAKIPELRELDIKALDNEKL